MNYRHAFHAGNFADVVKHATLARVLDYLKRKPAAFRVIDTHAGLGVYDLSSDEALRTGEWQGGIGRLIEAEIPENIAALLEPYFETIRDLNSDDAVAAYPGSPEIARRLTRRNDRLTLVELHPRDYEALFALYAGDRRIKAVELDGWLALGSFVPPKEKRGLVLVDPAFEETEEFATLADGLAKAHHRWPTGIYLLWYPIKDATKVRHFHEDIKASGIRRVLRAEFQVASGDKDGPLTGCGLLVVNPPYTLADELKLLLPWLQKTLATGPGAGHRLDWLVPE
ncbi:23S rRNA (adenine2030-N6)-methyltransferase [Rhodobium orientis]|uniref:Ribosomal RNA large subunit methyltransferase J n=1 Tax=Rhodobium orientis TaxID=34017 RepID=A0A327JUB7_9HYPH|nr:23S rRNA (adenine(2030)-N(6))-methyltransferase RlmJ [Rhodobium orientis]MBB4301148.1 23S rRNA (adenine2030-N6)-methyltransferase [Rhodobium orientis]MBK5949841.1 23S rRNA (adenine(2030)-N(6))-methyltransferase RlmJ [Rhodobium orientis]RAI30079.1 23S rRNA (adenine(2030)-N(6))-methyltransferase RlmJ [Rhodobium orientis]